MRCITSRDKDRRTMRRCFATLSRRQRLKFTYQNISVIMETLFPRYASGWAVSCALNSRRCCYRRKDETWRDDGRSCWELGSSAAMRDGHGRRLARACRRLIRGSRLTHVDALIWQSFCSGTAEEGFGAVWQCGSALLMAGPSRQEPPPGGPSV